MSTKIKILDSTIEFDLQRGMAVPSEGEIFYIKLKGETEERMYQVHLVEHFLDLNIPVTTTKSIITLKQIGAQNGV